MIANSVKIDLEAKLDEVTAKLEHLYHELYGVDPDQAMQVNHCILVLGEVYSSLSK